VINPPQGTAVFTASLQKKDARELNGDAEVLIRQHKGIQLG
jgi:hypothetical protein